MLIDAFKSCEYTHCEAQEQGRLSNVAVANQQDFEQGAGAKKTIYWLDICLQIFAERSIRWSGNALFLVVGRLFAHSNASLSAVLAFATAATHFQMTWLKLDGNWEDGIGKLFAYSVDEWGEHWRLSGSAWHTARAVGAEVTERVSFFLHPNSTFRIMWTDHSILRIHNVQYRVVKSLNGKRENCDVAPTSCRAIHGVQTTNVILLLIMHPFRANKSSGMGPMQRLWEIARFFYKVPRAI